jgi:hypothetical protein
MWVPGETTVLRDAKGFVLTGRDLLANAACGRIRKERREPLPLEGDVRAGAMNRVASAVGRGLDAGAIRSRIAGTDLNRFTLFAYPPPMTSSTGPCSR